MRGYGLSPLPHPSILTHVANVISGDSATTMLSPAFRSPLKVFTSALAARLHKQRAAVLKKRMFWCMVSFLFRRDIRDKSDIQFTMP